MALTVNPAFAEKTICPVSCEGIGAFKKVDKTPEQALEDRDKTKETQAATRDQPRPQASFEPSSGDGEPRDPPKYEYLPGLKPGQDGKVNWTPLASMTGTRPNVSRYSLSRYSLDEWRAHNERVLDAGPIVNANIIDYNAKSAMMQAFGDIDKTQIENNKRLKTKAKDIYRWKTEVEQAAKAISQEVEILEAERQRLKGASRTLMLPEAISKECLELRACRAIPDLVADVAETELVKEMSMVKEIRETFTKTLQNIEEQQAINKAAKQRIEYDWCDKSLAYNCETINLGLSPKSNTIMFRPGATRFGDYTAPLEYWEYFCRKNIEDVEAARQKSVDLRSGLQAVMDQGGRKLRAQADKTDLALAETIAITEELVTKTKKMLLDCLQMLADIENLIEELHKSIRKMDAAMKLAQTRLDNRNNWRPHGENVRDQPHYGLLAEVKKIHETVTALRGQLQSALASKEELMKKRITLERDLAAKSKTLNIDRDRCGMIRSHFPTASELAGY